MSKANVSGAMAAVKEKYGGDFTTNEDVMTEAAHVTESFNLDSMPEEAPLLPPGW